MGWIPSVYVIDREGVIRAREVNGKALDAAVETLMAEADRSAVGARPGP